MAYYIPECREYIPTTTEYTGTLTMIRKGNDQDLKCLMRSFEQSKHTVLGKDKIFIQSRHYDEYGFGNKSIVKVVFEFQVNGEPTETLWTKLVQLGKIERHIKQNYDYYDHCGYVKHDVEKRHNVSETIMVILQDILPDKEGNEWEVFVMESESYWDEDLEETRDECIEKHLFKTQAEAEVKYAELVNHG